MIVLPTRLRSDRNQPYSYSRTVMVVSFTVILLALVSRLCGAQDRRSPLIEKRVEEVLREASQASGAAGIAFGMVQSGSTVLECYTGYASWADKRRIDSSTVFNWASLSKSLTAVCALKMAEEKRLNLDADIKHYLPELGLQVPVTLRQLLAQQGGIGRYEDYPELLELKKLDRKALTQQVILEKMAGRKTLFKPGTHLGYSSPAYILLSLAMERAVKKPFAEIVDEIVGKPLKLSSLRVGGTSKKDVVPYQLVRGIRQTIDETNEDWRLGAGAIKSNMPDALRFASALIKSSILKPESSKELFKRRAIMKLKGDKEEVIGITYGFLRFGQGSDAPIVVSGRQHGARSILMIFPRAKMASVIFANTTPLDLEKIQLKAMEILRKK